MFEGALVIFGREGCGGRFAGGAKAGGGDDGQKHEADQPDRAEGDELHRLVAALKGKADGDGGVDQDHRDQEPSGPEHGAVQGANHFKAGVDEVVLPLAPQEQDGGGIDEVAEGDDAVQARPAQQQVGNGCGGQSDAKMQGDQARRLGRGRGKGGKAEVEEWPAKQWQRALQGDELFDAIAKAQADEQRAASDDGKEGGEEVARGGEAKVEAPDQRTGDSGHRKGQQGQREHHHIGTLPVLDPVCSVLDQVSGQRTGGQPIVSVGVLAEVLGINPHHLET